MSAIQQFAQHKASAYSAEGATFLLGISLTKWATVIGIFVAIGGLVLAYLTYRSNRWKNEEIVREMKEYHGEMEDIARRKHGQDDTD